MLLRCSCFVHDSVLVISSAAASTAGLVLLLRVRDWWPGEGCARDAPVHLCRLVHAVYGALQ
jgi:hypothetical protein